MTGRKLYLRLEIASLKIWWFGYQKNKITRPLGR
jgi:hypothetical protein